MKNIFFLLISFLLFFVGCSSGQSPVTLDAVENEELPVVETDQISPTGLFVSGLWTLHITDNLEVDLTSLREANVGETYTVNGGYFFESITCYDCLKITDIGLDADGNILLKFKIRHPYEKGDPSVPESARNRMDLDVFDVQLVVRPTNLSPTNFQITDEKIYDGILINTDGYTKEISCLISDDTLIPYKICYESQNYNRFEMGANWKDFELIIGEPMNFELYLTFSYGISARFRGGPGGQFPNRLDPDYYVPEFNRKDAWKVDVIPPVWYEEDTTTEHVVTVYAHDWNHGIEVDPSFPDSNHKNQLKTSSDIETIAIEIPGMSDSLAYPMSHNNKYDVWDPVGYNIPIANENGLEAGEYVGIVKVVDSRPPCEPLIDPVTYLDHTGFEKVRYDEYYCITEYATYQTFRVLVLPGTGPVCGPITGEILFPNCPYEIEDRWASEFSVSASSENAEIVLYEVDWDYTPCNFNVNESDDEGEFSHIFYNTNCGGTNDPITYTVAFRATDSCDPPNVTIFATCEVTVNCPVVPPCGPITGQIDSPSCPVTDLTSGDIIDFTVSASSENANIVSYEADYEYDGVTFDINDSNNDGIFSNVPFTVPDPCGSNIPQTITVAFRATDSCDPQNVTIFAICDVTVENCPTFPERGWATNFGDEGTGVAVNSGGNIYVATNSYSTSWDGNVVKFDEHGFPIWILTLASDGWDKVHGIDLDNSDDVYVTGSFNDTVNFDPIFGIEERTSNGYGDVFLAKYNPNGNLFWVQSWGGIDIDRGYEVVCYQDSVYVAGIFNGTIEFDPNGGDIHTAEGNWSIFLSKFDSGGNFQWAQTWCSVEQNDTFDGVGLCTDGSGGVYVSKYFQGTVDFDPGPGTQIREVHSIGDYDVFVSKFRGDNGQFVWVRTWGGLSADVGLGLTSSGNNVYVVGTFYSNSVDFDPSSGEDIIYNNGNWDGFLTCLNIHGDYQWTQTWESVEKERGTKVAADDSGNVYVTGFQRNGLDEYDIWLEKFNSSGTSVWNRIWAGPEYEEGFNLTTDDLGNIFLTGYFMDTVDFDPGSGVHNLTAQGEQDAFLLKLLPNGYWE